jgi:Uma2 family endonuclease
MIQRMPSLPPELPLTELDIPDELMPESDGVPVESQWHRDEMILLIAILSWHFRGREDFYVGGNQCIYYSLQQVLNRDFQGPDFFYVKGVSRTPTRERWIVWREGGRYPNVIVELLSSSTAENDRTTKKDIYEQTFRTEDYFCYDPYTGLLEGWRLKDGKYAPIAENERGWLWSEELQLWLGQWQCAVLGYAGVWLRFFTPDGQLVLTAEEAQRQRAEGAEAELARLRALLSEKGNDRTAP